MITRGMGPRISLFITRGLGFIKEIISRIIDLVARRRLLMLIANPRSIELATYEREGEAIISPRIPRIIDLATERTDFDLEAQPYSREIRGE